MNIQYIENWPSLWMRVLTRLVLMENWVFLHALKRESAVLLGERSEKIFFEEGIPVFLSTHFEN